MNEATWLMAKEIPRLRRYALALTNDPQAADDLVQDCLERGIRKRHLWKRYGSIRNWLYRILYNLYLNGGTHRARARRHIALDDMPYTPAAPAWQDQQLACRDIAQALQSLPEAQRAAIILTGLEELTYEEAAQVLDVPVGTLRSRLARGRERLRKLFSAQEAAPRLRQVE